MPDLVGRDAFGQRLHRQVLDIAFDAPADGDSQFYHALGFFIERPGRRAVRRQGVKTFGYLRVAFFEVRIIFR